MNQCWNIVNRTCRNKLQGNFNLNSNIFIQENAFENVVRKFAAILSRPQCVKPDMFHSDMRKYVQLSVIVCQLQLIIFASQLLKAKCFAYLRHVIAWYNSISRGLYAYLMLWQCHFCGNLSGTRAFVQYCEIPDRAILPLADTDVGRIDMYNRSWS